MNKFSLTPIENEGKRVLTTAQIAESYETSTKTIADTVAFIGVLHRRELSEGYIRKFYEDFLLILDCPEVFGNPVKSDELQKLYSEKYKIDFERIKCNYYSFDEYRHK